MTMDWVKVGEKEEWMEVSGVRAHASARGEDAIQIKERNGFRP